MTGAPGAVVVAEGFVNGPAPRKTTSRRILEVGVPTAGRGLSGGSGRPDASCLGAEGRTIIRSAGPTSAARQATSGRRRQDAVGEPGAGPSIVVAMQHAQRLRTPPAMVTATDPIQQELSLAVQQIPAVLVAFVRASHKDAVFGTADENVLASNHVL